MSDQSSDRDEKGLTLSGRTMLRLLVQFTKLLAASNKLGDKGGYELLQSPMTLVEIRSLLWIATEMGKRIGTIQEVETYLNIHADADGKTISEGLNKSGRAILEEVLENSELDKCEKCGGVKCPMCQECHSCDPDQELKPTHKSNRKVIN